LAQRGLLRVTQRLSEALTARPPYGCRDVAFRREHAFLAIRHLSVAGSRPATRFEDSPQLGFANWMIIVTVNPPFKRLRSNRTRQSLSPRFLHGILTVHRQTSADRRPRVSCFFFCAGFRYDFHCHLHEGFSLNPPGAVFIEKGKSHLIRHFGRCPFLGKAPGWTADHRDSFTRPGDETFLRCPHSRLLFPFELLDAGAGGQYPPPRTLPGSF